MEYTKFDDEELNNFFLEKIGTDKFTFDDIVKVFTTDEIKTEKKFRNFNYSLALKQFEAGLREVEPKKEDYVYETSYNIGEKNVDEFNKCINSMSIIYEEEITVHDLKLLKEIQEKVGKDKESGLDKIGICDTYKLKGTNCEINIDLDVKFDFSTISEEQISEIAKDLDRNKIIIKSFRGLTIEKLKKLGEHEYEIEGDLANPYSFSEIEHLLKIMESMELEDENAKDIDKFLHLYKSIGMYVDYDDSGNQDSEEYIEGNEKITRSARVLFSGRAVCVGYAKALQYAGNYLEMDIEEIGGKVFDDNGELLGDHAWNLVKIENEWYHTDLTWDYESIRKSKPLEYCLRNDEVFLKNRQIDNIYNVHICKKNYDEQEILELLANLPYTDLDKALFDATKEEGFQKTEMAEMLYDIIIENPNFSKEVLQGLKETQIEKTFNGTDR